MAQISTPALQNGPWGGAGLYSSPTERAIARWQKARGVRDRYNALWDDCFDYALPHRGRMMASTDGQHRTDKLYDTTAVTAVNEFASRLQAYICPIGARWATIKGGAAVKKEQKPEIDRQLKEVEEYVFSILENSNFDAAAHECFMDLSIGTMVMAIEPGDAVNPIIFTAIPLPELVLEVGADGTVKAFFRERRVRHRELPSLFPRAEIPPDLMERYQRAPDETCTVLESCELVPDPGTERWLHRVIVVERRSTILERNYEGAGSCPYIASFWSKAAGDTYGRGPVANTIGAIKVLNLIVELMLEHAEIQIFGMWQVDDDGFINPDTIEMVAGAMIPRAPGSNGIEALQPGGKIEWAQWGLEQHRGEIKRALYDEPLGNMQQDARIQTAQEVVERVADLSRRIGSSFGRMQAEFVRPAIRRVLYLLKMMGRITMPTLNGRVVEIAMTSPVARTQMAEEVVRIQRFGMVANELFGPGSSNLLLDKSETSEGLANRLGVPVSMVNSPQKIAAMEAQMQKMALLEKMLAGAGAPAPGPQGGLIPS